MNANTPVWYVGYGSNLSAARFDCYLRGGVPLGGRRDYRGCRDRTPPRIDVPLWIDGSIYFAGRSVTWGGGMAFLDPDACGRVPARGYLITAGQLSDVCAQEMRRPVGSIDLPVDTIVAHGRQVCGDGHYDLLLHLGDRPTDGPVDAPMLTFTSPRRLPSTPPSQSYLDMIAAGLVETHGWSFERATAHLAAVVED